MAGEAVKIFELSGDDWQKGISAHPTMPMGGLFQVANNFDPFEEYGIYQGAQQSSTVGSGLFTASGPDVWAKGIDDSGNDIIYFFDGANSTAKVVRMYPATPVLANVSAQVNTGAYQFERGATFFKDRVLYSYGNGSANVIWSNTKTLALAQQVTIVSAGIVNASDQAFRVGPDRNCYFTNGQYVGRITSVSGTTGNSAQYLSFEDDVTVVDLESDNRHLVIAGDTAQGAVLSKIPTRCFVAWWNMKSTDLTQIWDFPDAHIIAIRKLGHGNDFLVIGTNNVYVTNINTPPQPVIPIYGNSTFDINLVADGGPYMVDTWRGSVLWVSSDTTNVNAYGAPLPGMKRIFYRPFSGTPAFAPWLLVTTTDRVFIAGDGEDGLQEVAQGTTVQSAVLTIAKIVFGKRYKLSFVKVILDTDLASGQSISLQISNPGHSTRGIIFSSTTKTFAVVGARHELIFHPTTDSNAALTFDELHNIQITNNGAKISSFEIWAEPTDPKQAMN